MKGYFFSTPRLVAIFLNNELGVAIKFLPRKEIITKMAIKKYSSFCKRITNET